MLTTSIVNVCDYETPNWVLVYFNSVIKHVQQCCCTLILLPKSTLNANLTTTNRFFTNNDWQRVFSNRTINTNRISNRTYDSKSNRITKLRRSLVKLYSYLLVLQQLPAAHTKLHNYASNTEHRWNKHYIHIRVPVKYAESQNIQRTGVLCALLQCSWGKLLKTSSNWNFAHDIQQNQLILSCHKKHGINRTKHKTNGCGKSDL